ncbi:MAG: DUF116 domain-containing protein [Elusimicrobiota bacterium]|jgi:hypothetical protein|nr:DUF116 domain-containing protein [Elusimicrobiota bacterium]
MGICKSNRTNKQQIYVKFTEQQNIVYLKKFSKIPFEKRIIFVPHCMRNSNVCRAVEKGAWYVCVECGQCKISKINKMAKNLNYLALCILKGGRAIEKIINEIKPQAIVGVSCFFEGEQAFKLLENSGLAVQFIPLVKDGCTNTDVDLQAVEKVLSLKEKE